MALDLRRLKRLRMSNLLLSGGPLMIPLGICSVLGVSMILERLFFWFKQSRNNEPQLVAAVYELLSKKQNTEALNLANESKDSSLICVKACLESHQRIKPLTLESLASQVLKPTRRFEKGLETLITISPLLGILGTVLGIIASFKSIAPSGLGDPAAMMAGLSQALITTATGLSISILLLVFHNYFLKMSEAQQEKLEEELTLFEELAGS